VESWDHGDILMIKKILEFFIEYKPLIIFVLSLLGLVAVAHLLALQRYNRSLH
jgi:predicted RND superfamily exporter protein